jgi:hypothetical protein
VAEEDGPPSEFFLGAQIWHDGLEQVAKRPMDRFDAAAVAADLAADLELLGTPHLGLAYLDDTGTAPFDAAMADLASSEGLAVFAHGGASIWGRASSGARTRWPGCARNGCGDGPAP